jgi:hypothetical protein
MAALSKLARSLWTNRIAHVMPMDFGAVILPLSMTAVLKDALSKSDHSLILPMECNVLVVKVAPGTARNNQQLSPPVT